MTAVTRVGGAAFDAGVATNITTNTTTLVCSGPGTLVRIVIGHPAATGTVTIYDGLTAAGATIGTIVTHASPFPMTFEFNCAFNTGLCIVTATAVQNITVVHRP
jgi:gamma-glutamyltranspeptidase